MESNRGVTVLTAGDGDDTCECHFCFFAACRVKYAAAMLLFIRHTLKAPQKACRAAIAGWSYQSTRAKLATFLDTHQKTSEDANRDMNFLWKEVKNKDKALTKLAKENKHLVVTLQKAKTDADGRAVAETVVRHTLATDNDRLRKLLAAETTAALTAQEEVAKNVGIIARRDEVIKKYIAARKQGMDDLSKAKKEAEVRDRNVLACPLSNTL